MSRPLTTYLRGTTLLCTFVLVLSVPLQAADGVDADTAFERLKALEGTWEGTPEAEGLAQEEAQPQKLSLEFRVSAAGTVVMETMAPGTEDEMINMYHVDGDDLLVTHYCSSGNQPRMRLDRERSSDTVLVFDFLDATNLDPSREPHIHALRMEIEDGGRLESAWTSYQSGEPAGVMTVRLTRSQ